MNLIIFSTGHAVSVEGLRGFEVLKAKNDGLIIKGIGGRKKQNNVFGRDLEVHLVGLGVWARSSIEMEMCRMASRILA